MQSNRPHNYTHATPCAVLWYAAGASLCATEDGRRLYLFGGHDGRKLTNDCYYLEVERLMWSQINPSGSPPEPREQHVAAVLGKYLFITGRLLPPAPARAAIIRLPGRKGFRYCDSMLKVPHWHLLSDPHVGDVHC